MTPIEQAAQALNLALKFIAEPAGMTPEIVNDKESFGEFLDNCEARKNEAVASIRAALASLEAAKQEPPEFVLLPRNPRRLSNEQIQVLLRLENGRVAIFHAWEEIVALASCPGGRLTGVVRMQDAASKSGSDNSPPTIKSGVRRIRSTGATFDVRDRVHHVLKAHYGYDYQSVRPSLLDDLMRAISEPSVEAADQGRSPSGTAGSAGGFENTEREAVATWNRRAALPAPADPSGHEPGVRPTPAPGQCPQCGEYSMSARAAQGLYGTMVQQAQPSPVEGPRIPGRVLTYWHAYGDARADDDGSSPLRLSEAIKSTRSWAAAIASVPLPAPADQTTEPQGSSGSLSVYVASRASLPERPTMWRRLRSEGWAITSSWIDEAGEGETGDFSELWARITREIAAARGVILYAETGDFPLKGALIEVGIALGMGKTVAVVLPGVELDPRSKRPVGSWLAHPLVTISASVESARSAILASEPNTDAAVVSAQHGASDNSEDSQT